MHTHTRATLASPPTAPPEAVPSSVVCSSAPLGWHGIVVWRRQSPPTTVVLPPLTMHDVVLQLRAGPRLLQVGAQPLESFVRVIQEARAR